MTARNNGLRASAYAVLLEIEESLGDPMLEALAAREIAAYVVPVPGPGGATRLVLHVDVRSRIAGGRRARRAHPGARRRSAHGGRAAARRAGEPPLAGLRRGGGQSRPARGYSDGRSDGRCDDTPMTVRPSPRSWRLPPPRPRSAPGPTRRTCPPQRRRTRPAVRRRPAGGAAGPAVKKWDPKPSRPPAAASARPRGVT